MENLVNFSDTNDTRAPRSHGGLERCPRHCSARRLEGGLSIDPLELVHFRENPGENPSLKWMITRGYPNFQETTTSIPPYDISRVIYVRHKASQHTHTHIHTHSHTHTHSRSWTTFLQPKWASCESLWGQEIWSGNIWRSKMIVRYFRWYKSFTQPWIKFLGGWDVSRCLTSVFGALFAKLNLLQLWGK